MSDEPEKPAAVGYKQPPAATRYKPGQSGNPRGRPKGVQNLVTTAARIMRQKVTVIENGRRRSSTKLDAAVTQMTNRAVKGDARALQQLLELAAMVDGAPATGRAVDVKEADQAVVKNLMKRFGFDGSETDEAPTKQE